MSYRNSGYKSIKQKIHIYVTWMLEDFGGFTKVMSHPQSAVLLWMVGVLVSLIPGLMNAGCWATQLTHKQLKNTNLRHPSEPWTCMYEISKEETLPCMFYSLTQCGTPRYLEQSVSNLPHQKPNQNWTQGLVQEPFYTIVILHNQYSCDIIVMTSQSSVFPFRQEMPWCMSSRVMLTHLHICRCPPTYPMHPCMACQIKFCTPIPMAVTFSPRYFGAPSYWSLLFIKMMQK